MDNDKKRAELIDAVKQGREEQRKGLVVNFDEAYNAYKEAGNDIQVTFEGKQYSFPAEPSAEVMTYIIRNGSKMSNDMGMHLLRIIIGDEFLEAISRSRAPFRLIVETVLHPILETYGFGGAKYEEDSGNVDNLNS